MVKVINGGCIILLVFFIENPELEVRGSGARIDLERFFETLGRSGVIHLIDAHFASHKMRFFLLIQLTLPTGPATAESNGAKQQQCAADEAR